MAPTRSSPGLEVYDYKLPKIIAASSAGTLIEWYDFYIFGSLALILADRFYPPGNPTAAFLATLATSGFAVRPFGAVEFGRIGDIIGRKFTFVLTISIMGAATFIIGFLPTYAKIGLAARSSWCSSACSRAWPWGGVRRGGDLCRRARARRAPGLLHGKHPDHHDARPPPGLGRCGRRSN